MRWVFANDHRPTIAFDDDICGPSWFASCSCGWTACRAERSASAAAYRHTEHIIDKIAATPPPRVAGTAPGSPASAAGSQPGARNEGGAG